MTVKLNDYFSHDDTGSDEDRVYIEVAGLGSVCLIRSVDGLIIDVFPMQVTDGPIATMGVETADFLPSEEENP